MHKRFLFAAIATPVGWIFGAGSLLPARPTGRSQTRLADSLTCRWIRLLAIGLRPKLRIITRRDSLLSLFASRWKRPPSAAGDSIFKGNNFQLLDAADAREHDRQAALKGTLAQIEALKRDAQTPAQILRELPQYLPLPQPVSGDDLSRCALDARKISPRSFQSYRRSTAFHELHRKPQAGASGSKIRLTNNSFILYYAANKYYVRDYTAYRVRDGRRGQSSHLMLVVWCDLYFVRSLSK